MDSYIKKGPALVNGGVAHTKVIKMIQKKQYKGGNKALINDIKGLRRAQINPHKVMVVDRLQGVITFCDRDLEGVITPHDDPLIVELFIGGCLIKRVLIEKWK